MMIIGCTYGTKGHTRKHICDGCGGLYDAEEIIVIRFPGKTVETCNECFEILKDALSKTPTHNKKGWE